MRRAAFALLILAAPAAADGGRITFWDGAALHTMADPHAVIPALLTERRNQGTLIAPDVGLFIEPATGAPVHASNLVGGALVRRFAGHVALNRALGAGRVFTLRPHFTERGGVASVNWRLIDENGAEIGAIGAAARMSGSPEAGRPFAAFTAEDAERIAFQTAARLAEAPDFTGAINSAETLAKLERTPTPAARPETGPISGPAAPTFEQEDD